MNPNAYHVTRNGVTLPKGNIIPAEFTENPYGRIGSYGTGLGRDYVEIIRIDAGTPRGFKGPNDSHFHINNGKGHLTTGWPYKTNNK